MVAVTPSRLLVALWRFCRVFDEEDPEWNKQRYSTTLGNKDWIGSDRITLIGSGSKWAWTVGPQILDS